MQITVKLFASFRVGRFSAATHECALGTRIADVIGELGIPESQVGMIMLDNRHAEPDQQLQEGANLSLFPLLGGG